MVYPSADNKDIYVKCYISLGILNFIFRIQRPEMEVARAKIYPAECLRVFYLKYFRTQKNLSNVLIDISHFAAFRISVQLSIFPRDVMIV